MEERDYNEINKDAFKSLGPESVSTVRTQILKLLGKH